MDFYSIIKKPSGDELVEKYRTDFEYDDSVAKGEAPRCPRCNSFVGMLESVPPFQVHLETWGDGYGDLAFWMSDFLVTLRFRDEFERSGLSGLQRFDSTECLSHKHYGRKLGDPPEYFRTIPRIGGAKVDIRASEIERGEGKHPTCDLCLSGGGVLKRWKRIVIDESTWDGSDIFYPYGIPGALVVSKKFYNWAIAKRFRNLTFRQSADHAHDFYPWESATR
ncbi:MAG: hypothetical protein JJU36_14320 [Phycisphaeraceae bacterium]|nr:hypothetical protein [Phycisphaeraceae bacterium]